MHFYQTREYKAELTTHSLYFLLFLQFSPSLSWSLFFISIYSFLHSSFPITLRAQNQERIEDGHN